MPVNRTLKRSPYVIYVAEHSVFISDEATDTNSLYSTLEVPGGGYFGITL